MNCLEEFSFRLYGNRYLMKWSNTILIKNKNVPNSKNKNLKLYGEIKKRSSSSWNFDKMHKIYTVIFVYLFLVNIHIFTNDAKEKGLLVYVWTTKTMNFVNPLSLNWRDMKNVTKHALSLRCFSLSDVQETRCIKISIRE